MALLSTNNICFDGKMRKLIFNYSTHFYLERPGPKVIKLFSCSTELSRKFQLLIKTKMLKNKDFLAVKLSDTTFILLINAKMPTNFNIYQQDKDSGLIVTKPFQA